MRKKFTIGLQCLFPCEGGGHLNCLKWARELFCDWDEDTCSFAALNGHLSCLNWARENACEWDEVDFCFVRNISFFAREQRCHWDPKT